jgi:hypothetical protein
MTVTAQGQPYSSSRQLAWVSMQSLLRGTFFRPQSSIPVADRDQNLSRSLAQNLNRYLTSRYRAKTVMVTLG